MLKNKGIKKGEIMKRISFFSMALGLSLLVSSSVHAIDWVHNVTNATSGTVRVALYASKGLGAPKGQATIKPGQTEAIHTGIFCIVEVVAIAQNGPLSGQRATYGVPGRKNLCSGHNYTVIEKGDRIPLGAGATQSGTGNVSITTSSKQYDPNLSIDYQNNPYTLRNGELYIRIDDQ